MNEPTQYKRVLLKLSGESLVGDKDYGIDMKILSQIVQAIKNIHQKVELAIVIGGGNIFRGEGLANAGMDRATGDYAGMLGTVINAMVLQDSMEKENIATRLMSALQIKQVCEAYIRRKAIRHLEKGRVVIFAAGTGNPFFTTDTAASLRAAEISADFMIKATRVNGIYDADPETNKDSVLYQHLHYDEVIKRDLGVMDTAAIAICRENKIPFRVLNIFESQALEKAVAGEAVGTLVN